MAPLNSENKERVLALADGSQSPHSGMEKHFVEVIHGKGRACTDEEKGWLSYWQDCQKPKSPAIVPPKKSNKNVRKNPSTPRWKNHVSPQDSHWKDSSGDKSKSTLKETSGNKVRPRRTADRDSEPQNPCINCGNEIPSARLKINPNVQRCVPCQTYLEKNNPDIAKRNADEGIAGTREDNKKMRSILSKEIRTRGK